MSSPNILVTGTTGRVGKAIMPALRSEFKTAEFDLKVDNPNRRTRFQGDVADIGALAVAVDVVRPDCIVHLAANANQDATTEEIYRPNIIGMSNVLEIARTMGVERVVFASSLHTLSGYPGFPDQSPFSDGRQFQPTDTPNPGNPYGASKVFGEQLGRMYQREGIKTVSLRLGDLNNANEPSYGTPYVPVWLSHRDAVNAFTSAITAELPDPAPAYFVTSRHPDNIYDITPTIRDLGYAPVDQKLA